MSGLRSIAHYAVEQELGRGGMGVVYRAMDTRLGRAVAIKSLPAEFVQDVVWRTRFEGEARTLAAINHPNIAAIYGIESDETGTYLVLELAEGPTLSDHIRRSSPGVSDALELTRQIALGLSVAHEREIVHRDLKPANVKVRPDGLVKVLDFGIAKSGRGDDPVDPLAATLVQKVNPVSTVQAFLLGTPGYMSPEQARGHAITPATDVWALGCVLYETLTHQMAFGGDTLADAIALTLLGEPDYGALPRQTPGRVLRLIQACLAKKAGERPASMREVTGVIEDSLRELSVGRVFLGARSGSAGADEGPAEAGNVPHLDRVLIGRDAVVKQVAGALEQRRLVTLTGGSGSGLTSVAQAVGVASAGAFPGGAWWVPLPGSATAETQAVLCAISLGVRGRGSGVVAELIERIGARRALLVLDGVTGGAGGGSFIFDVLRACPGLRVLATSRSQLHGPGEMVVALPPLGGAPELPEHLDPAKLFLECLTPVEAAAWKERASSTVRLCSLLKGSPLSIVVAAGLAPTMSPVQFETQLRQRAQMAGAELESITHERLAQVMVAWGMDGQAVANIAVLLRASVFAGSWSLRSLRAVGGAADAMPGTLVSGLPTQAEVRLGEQLDRLIRAGLVRRTVRSEDPAFACFALPDAVRREAINRLNGTAGAAAMVQKGYVGFVHALADLASGPMSPQAALQLEQHYGDLLHASGLGGDPGRIEAAKLGLLRSRGLV